MPPSTPRSTFLVLLGLLLAACTAPPAADVPATSDAWTADLTVADTPLVEFGRDQATLGYDLSSFIDAHLLSDGRVTVLSRDVMVRIFAADGKHVAAYGGRGEGPGQFRWAKALQLPGDTILVYDGTSKRATYLDPSTGLVRTVTYGSEVPSHLSRPVGHADGGSLLLSSLNSWSDSRAPLGGDSSRTGAEVTLARPDGSHRLLFTLKDVLLTPRPAPFGPAGVLILDDVRYGGVAQLVFHEGGSYAIEGGSRDVVVRGADGKVIRQFRLAVPRAPVTDRDRESLIRKETEPLRTMDFGGHAPPPNPQAALGHLETSVFADSLPPVDDLLLDVELPALWVVHGRPFDAPTWRASRVSLNGDPLGAMEVDLPGSRLVAIRGDRVLLARTDTLGVTWFELREIVGKR